MSPNKKTKSKRKAGDENDFPGYPQYSPKDDIEVQGKRVSGNFDGETLPSEKEFSKGPETKKTPVNAANEADLPADSEDLPEPGEYDVTAEDMQALGPPDLSLDLGEDEQLKQRTRPVDFAGEDLDVPGSEMDDQAEETGAEDEENNIYSRSDGEG